VPLTGSAPESSGSTERRRAPRVAAVAGLILLVALAIRVAEVQRTAYRPTGDSAAYLRLASQVARTGDYPANGAAAGHSTGPTAYYPPAFPYLLGLVDLVDGHTAPGNPALEPDRLTGALLGTAIVALIGLVAVELFGPAVALLALAIAAVYPPLVELSAALVAENLLVALELAAVWTALRAHRNLHGTRWIAATGALVGLAALAHGNGILLALPLGFAMSRLPGLGSDRRRLAPLAMLTAMVAAVVPWVIRDAIVMHRAIPISDQTGMVLEGTYNPRSAASHDPQYRWISYARIRDDRDIRLIASTLTEPQLESRLLHRALSYVSAHPGSPFAAAYDNVRRLLELEGAAAWRRSAAAIGIGAGTARAGVVGFWIVALLALAGACTRLARRAPRWLWGVPAVMALAAVLINAETPRLREPIDPFLILLAACALATLMAPLLPAEWLPPGGGGAPEQGPEEEGTGGEEGGLDDLGRPDAPTGDSEDAGEQAAPAPPRPAPDTAPGQLPRTRPEREPWILPETPPKTWPKPGKDPAPNPAPNPAPDPEEDPQPEPAPDPRPEPRPDREPDARPQTPAPRPGRSVIRPPVRRDRGPGAAAARAQAVEVIERVAGAERDARQRRVDPRHGHPGVGSDELREAVDQSAAAGQQDPVAGDVAGELGRGLLERVADRSEDLGDRAPDGVADLARAQLDRRRQAGQQVPAADLGARLLRLRDHRADLDLDRFGHPRADRELVYQP
jgi:outer membrane biosynthesis protein TonB